MPKHTATTNLALAFAQSLLLTALFTFSQIAEAAPSRSMSYILTDRSLLEKLKIEPLAAHGPTDTVFARVSEEQRELIMHQAHDLNRCGGHELLTEIPANTSNGQARETANRIFKALDEQILRDEKFLKSKSRKAGIGLPPQPGTKDPEIEKAIAEVSETNLRDTVNFLSQYPSRNHKTADGQRAVQAFKTRVEDTLKGTTIPFTIELVTHQSTPMNSIRLTFKGASRPSEVVVVGAHIDSINGSYFGSKSAPGSDDNASGSANVLEAARILAKGKQPERTIEFYWYAGEEGGLLGSAEIAKSAKSANKNVVGVLQLDMTLFPGDGEFTLGSMTDFTSAEMRDLLQTINRDYIGATIIEDKCGYGCSDHASWYRNGFPTLMPFEATMKRMNGNIHTDKDVVSASLSFRHSAMFTKIAIAFLSTLSR